MALLPSFKKKTETDVSTAFASLYVYVARDRKGKDVRGEMKANGTAQVGHNLRKMGLVPVSIGKKGRLTRSKAIKEKDIALFTRQLSTMMRSGVPLLQSFDIVAKGHSNPAVTKLLFDIKSDVETGSNLSVAFAKHPRYFDPLFVNLVQAGEQAGILESLLDKLATYKEKTLKLKAKIKGAMFYPIAVISAAFIITAVIMIFVVPAFKEIFAQFGAELPGPTVIVINLSDAFVKYWYLIFGTLFCVIYGLITAKKRIPQVREFIDKHVLRIPVFGELLLKSTIARWCSTLATMFAAGVPLVEALDSVAGASGNFVYYTATKKIQSQVSTGTSLTVAMQNSNVFPNMVLQMTSIGEESGALDSMLGKVADFYEAEVDDMVDALSSLMEPIIMSVLGVVIGGLIVAMYLPIFKMGSAIH